MKTLKNIIIILIASAVFQSCSSDDSETPTIQEANLIGTWKLVSETENGVEVVESTDCDILLIVTETTLRSDEYFGSNCENVEQGIAESYTIVGNTISITADGETFTATILELNANTFRAAFTDTEGETNTPVEIISTYVK